MAEIQVGDYVKVGNVNLAKVINISQSVIDINLLIYENSINNLYINKKYSLSRYVYDFQKVEWR